MKWPTRRWISAKSRESSCGAACPALLLALAGGWWLTRKALAPVAALTQAAERINERSLREQLPRSGSGDELDRLTEVFNAMTARLDGSFQRVREFTLHASHELKTPLTVLRGELETALREEKTARRPSPPACLSQIDEIDRLTKIVDGLTPADQGRRRPGRAASRTGAAGRTGARKFRRRQHPGPACRHPRLPAGLRGNRLQGDRHRLRQLLLNLTDNAIKYNHPGGAVAISLRRDGETAELRMANTGAGLAPELQPRVFERFFRGDASHNREVEGCGLGLSIAQWIVTAHGGAIQFDSEPGQLTTWSYGSRWSAPARPWMKGVLKNGLDANRLAIRLRTGHGSSTDVSSYAPTFTSMKTSARLARLLALPVVIALFGAAGCAELAQWHSSPDPATVAPESPQLQVPGASFARHQPSRRGSGHYACKEPGAGPSRGFFFSPSVN